MESGVQANSWRSIMHMSCASFGRCAVTLASCEIGLLASSMSASHWSIKLKDLIAHAAFGRDTLPIGFGSVLASHQWTSFDALPLVRSTRLRVNIHSELLCISWLSSVRASMIGYLPSSRPYVIKPL